VNDLYLIIYFELVKEEKIKWKNFFYPLQAPGVKITTNSWKIQILVNLNQL